MTAKYLISSSRIQGQSHIKSDVPCQDYARNVDNELYKIIVACDGAGTAKRAEEGSKLFSLLIVEEFIRVAKKLEKIKPGDWLIDEIVTSVVTARENLRIKTGSDNLSPFHTTLVSAICGESGGFICHVGDGYGIAITEKDGQLNTTISSPSNGEYANETYFVTESSWIKNLNITPFSGRPILVAVMSDGAGALFENKSTFETAKLIDLMKAIDPSNTVDEQIRGYLNSEYANAKSSDDKCISFIYSIENSHSALKDQLSNELMKDEGIETIKNIELENPKEYSDKNTKKSNDKILRNRVKKSRVVKGLALSVLMVFMVALGALVYKYKNLYFMETPPVQKETEKNLVEPSVIKTEKDNSTE
jgi:hypothetical protein